MNKEYNEWTVLEYSQHKNGRPYYWCQCSCGTVKEVEKYNLIYGKSKNCGCVRKQKLSEKLFKDLTGQKFGRLTAIYREPGNSNNNKVRWFCKCDCGNEVIVLANSLLTNHTRSCGCWTSQTPSNIKQYIENKYKYKVEREYHIDLKNTDYDMNFLRFDLFIPELQVAIEYDGEQHYKPINYGGGVEEAELHFEYTRKNDMIKNQYCLDNNISLLRIPFWKKDNFPEIIDNFLSTYND